VVSKNGTSSESSANAEPAEFWDHVFIVQEKENSYEFSFSAAGSEASIKLLTTLESERPSLSFSFVKRLYVSEET